MRGDPDPDTLNGDGGNDVIQGGAGDDICNGGDKNDVVSGGVGYDTLDGGARDDIVHGGRGFDIIRGGSGSDELWAQDYFEDDEINPGTTGSDNDKCIVDRLNLNSAYDDPPITGGDGECEAGVVERAACAEKDLLVANVESGNVRLYQLGTTDGDTNGDALLQFNGTWLATDVDGIAVDPDNCDIHAVLTYSSTQYLVVFAPALSETNDKYTAASHTQITGGSSNTLVDIDFDPAGDLFGLESHAELVAISTSAVKSSELVVGSLGTGVHLSFDEPDGDYFFVVTSGGGAHEVYTVEHHRDRASFVAGPSDARMPEAVAMDWTAGGAGRWHQIASDNKMYYREHRSWESTAHNDTPNCGGQCTADVASPESATMAHWFVP